MNDREMLEYAAKAAKLEGYSNELGRGPIYRKHHTGLQDWVRWNPLTDDGDAFRLMVRLSQLDGGVALMLNSRLNSTAFAQCYTNEETVAPPEYMMEDPLAATRRAITRAAAEIGRTMG